MDWTVIFRKIIWEVRPRKLWSKLLDFPARGMPQKRVNLRRSEQHSVGFMTYKFLIN